MNNTSNTIQLGHTKLLITTLHYLFNYIFTLHTVTSAEACSISLNLQGVRAVNVVLIDQLIYANCYCSQGKECTLQNMNELTFLYTGAVFMRNRSARCKDIG